MIYNEGLVEILRLSSEQEKAFKALESAYKKCKKVNIKFYTILSSIYCLNGKNLVRVHDDSHASGKNVSLSYIYKQNPFLEDSGFSGWADDRHYAEIK